MAKGVPSGSWFLASKKDGAPEETWTLIVTGTHLGLLEEIAEFVAWKYKDPNFRYLIAEGQSGKIAKYPFRYGIFTDVV